MFSAPKQKDFLNETLQGVHLHDMASLANRPSDAAGLVVGVMITVLSAE